MAKTLYSEEKAQILKAAMPDLVFDGFSDEVVAKAAAQAGLDKDKARLALPRGGVDLAIYFIQQGTEQMVHDLAQKKLLEMKIRDRIQTAVMTRLEIDTPQKEVAQRAFAILALPAYAQDALALLGKTVDEMWRAAGDTSTDGNYYSKRLILSGVYTSTRMVWFQDESYDAAETRAFLGRRIEDVMKIEKGKAQWRDLKEKLPDPLAVLSNLRFGG
ncbi:MAG: COQ9 family protein [Parvibaculales bacterium]